MKFLRNSILFVAFLVLIQGCDDDEMTPPDPPNEEEVITTLRMTLTPTAGGDNVVFQFQDLDGDGGGAPSVVDGDMSTLVPNTEYTAAMEFLNESETPAEDITEEVEEEALEHQIFFQTDVPNLVITYGDTDADGNPVGLTNQVQTGDAGNGSLTVTLIHEPMKDAAGVSDGDITNAEGEVDIEVTFDVSVE